MDLLIIASAQKKGWICWERKRWDVDKYL